MGGESSSSTAGSGTVPADRQQLLLPPCMGSEKELVKIAGAQLCLIDGEESMVMQSGEFSLRLLKQARTPLAAVVAAVGQVQWPVGKDAPVLKVWNRRYTFALPSLVYGIVFPDDTSAEAIELLEDVMDRFCTFQVHHQEIVVAATTNNNAAAEKLLQMMIPKSSSTREGTTSLDVAEYWTGVAPDVETLSSRIARQICSTSSIVANSIVKEGQRATLGIQQQAGSSTLARRSKGSAAGAASASSSSSAVAEEGMASSSSRTGVSPRMMKRMQQARRMSAVAKMMSKTLLNGAISATGHVAGSLHGLQPDVAAVHATRLAPPSPLHNTEAAAAVANETVTVASVDAFAQVAEAVETAGKSVYGASSAVGTDLVQQRFGLDAGKVVRDSMDAVGNVINTAWTLNKIGLRMLLQVAAASTALNHNPRTAAAAARPWKTSSSSQCSSTAKTTTSSSDEQQQQQQQPSSPASATSTMSPLLFHQITLSPPPPPQQQQSDEQAETDPVLPLNLLPPAASETLSLRRRPTRTQTLFGTGVPNQLQLHQTATLSSSSSSFTPRGNFTSSQPPAAAGSAHPSSTSPGFQQYSSRSQAAPISPAPPPSSPFNFPFGSFMDQSKTPGPKTP
ncbi:hypothetical protein BDL97_02G137900 [Sphagnum fallax]|nr:hypothetical protein BDL97_02G137900 [Sphagnum fallax]